MHRHGYVGRKFNRECDQREALVRSLAISLIDSLKIETTIAKAKTLVPFVERLITKAKQGDLSSRRQLIASLNQTSANRLIEVIVPQLKNRNSGHLRLKRSRFRVGDNAQMAVVEFVDDIKTEAVSDAKPAAVKQEKNDENL